MVKDFKSLQGLGFSSEMRNASFMPYTEDGETKTININFKQLAKDAALTTSANIGFPAEKFTLISPQVVQILLAVRNAGKIFGGEVHKGKWTDDYQQFRLRETVGAVSPYSDYSSGLTTKVNREFPVRESFRFETVVQYGDLEVEKAGELGFQAIAELQEAGAEVLAVAANNFYLYGVAGKKVYGLLNDPNLNSSEAPVTVNNKTTWKDKREADSANFPTVVFSDILKLFNSLVSQNKGHVDANTTMVLCISNTRAGELVVPNSYGLTAEKLLKQSFPNLSIVTLPELTTTAGEYLFLVVPTLYGVKTGEMAYSEKLRMGRVIDELSSRKQKMMSATWGCVLVRPSLVASMLGI